MSKNMTYEICLVITENILLQISKAINENYKEGTYSKILSDFHSGKLHVEDWYMKGELGTFMVRNEVHESYLYCKASGSNIEECKEIMWIAYITAGGNSKLYPNPKKHKNL